MPISLQCLDNHTGYDMQLIAAERVNTNAQRQADYRQRNPERYRRRNATRMRKVRADAVPEFFGVDSEGIGRGKNHRAVLVSTYNKQGIGESYIARDLDRGLQWAEVFEFLYGQFLLHPSAAFTGFYLSYDFNEWLKTLPQHAAVMLLSSSGIRQRKIKNPMGRRQSHPVRVDGWEIDSLGLKRLSFRPIVDGCVCGTKGVHCEAEHSAWMHICDSGPFYQMPFIKLINPATWEDDPDGPVCTPEEFKRIKRNKEVRGIAKLDAEMEYYNRLENIILARVMERLAKGYLKIGVRLAKDQWYGPGAAAAKWLQKHGGVKRDSLRHKEGKKPAIMPRWFWDACQASYFGGWFEIFSHGVIEGTSYNYDINNAYPYAATKLPHICRECGYRQGKGAYRSHSEYVLLYCTVYAKGYRMGPMPYRDNAGNILRPKATKGWYWKFEIDAARRANLVEKVITHEWREFTPCSHPEPFKEIRRLYSLRLEVGKSSAQGMAIKLTNNSIYGKFAQSVGAAPYNNWFYASYITAHCRAQILDAIATHPDKADAVLMVATDGICFDSPHPSLTVSIRLGEWDHTTYTDLCLFKPGVYWHREGKEALLKVKSRGVPKEEFAKAIDEVEAEFRRLLAEEKTPVMPFEEAWELYGDTHEWQAFAYLCKNWPNFRVPVKFRMKSCKQALNEGNWGSAGEVQESVTILQNSDPQSKRRRPWFNKVKHRIDTEIHDLQQPELAYPKGQSIQTKYHGEIEWPKMPGIGFGWEGSALDPILEVMSIVRDKPANYDLPLDEMEWEVVWGD